MQAEQGQADRRLPRTSPSPEASAARPKVDGSGMAVNGMAEAVKAETTIPALVLPTPTELKEKPKA